MTDLNPLLHHPTITLLGQVFLHFLWQGAVVGLFLLVVLNLLKPRNARLRYGAGSIALLAMLALPPLTAWWLASSPVNPVPSEPARHAAPDTTATTGVPAPVDNTARPVTVSLPAHLSDIEVEPPAAPSSSLIKLDNVRETKQSFLPWLTLFWLLGASLLSLRLLGGWLTLQRLRTRGTKRAPEVLQSKLAEFSGKLRITRRVRLLESTVVHVPLVIGWLRPVILLPASAVSGLNPAQLEAILAHELAHIRRHDALVNLLQRLAETLLFYHPAVWWVSCQVEREREHCCDDIAVSTCGDALMYAIALAQIEGLRARHGMSLAANGGSLLQRLKRLAGEPVPSVYSPVRAAVGLLTLTVLTLSITALSQSPTQAQESDTSLGARELQNIAAFVQLLGYVLYFHPSDAVETTDWDAFTVSHIESVEDAANPKELAERLATLFRPYAPLLRVFPTGESPDPPEGLLMPDDIEPLFVTMWAHAPLGGQLRGKRLSGRVTQGKLPETIPYQGGREFEFLPETISLRVPDPREPYLVALRGGISAAIPLTLYADSQGTLPHAQVPPELGVMPPASEARALQLAAVATIWNAMQHFILLPRCGRYRLALSAW